MNAKYYCTCSVQSPCFEFETNKSASNCTVTLCSRIVIISILFAGGRQMDAYCYNGVPKLSVDCSNLAPSKVFCTKYIKSIVNIGDTVYQSVLKY